MLPQPVESADVIRMFVGQQHIVGFCLILTQYLFDSVFVVGINDHRVTVFQEDITIPGGQRICDPLYSYRFHVQYTPVIWRGKKMQHFLFTQGLLQISSRQADSSFSFSITQNQPIPASTRTTCPVT